MSIIYKQGNIFNAKTQVIVNTVNCVGVMGKGIALVFKLRYPKMFDIYKEHCRNYLIDIGKLWLYKGAPDVPWVLNFPTKVHWKYPSKLEYVEQGLIKFVRSYKVHEITSIAFPLLGTHNGGLDRDIVLSLMMKYLKICEIPIEIYEYDPSVPDDLFENFVERWNQMTFTEIMHHTGIPQNKFSIISKAISSKSINSMVGLINEPGIGLKTLEQCFQFVLHC